MAYMSCPACGGTLVEENDHYRCSDVTCGYVGTICHMCGSHIPGGTDDICENCLAEIICPMCGQPLDACECDSESSNICPDCGGNPCVCPGDVKITVKYLVDGKEYLSVSENVGTYSIYANGLTSHKQTGGVVSVSSYSSYDVYNIVAGDNYVFIDQLPAGSAPYEGGVHEESVVIILDFRSKLTIKFDTSGGMCDAPADIVSYYDEYVDLPWIVDSTYVKVSEGNLNLVDSLSNEIVATKSYDVFKYSDFVCWRDSRGVDYAYGDITTKTNIWLYAVWSHVGEATALDELDLPVLTKDGYTFLGWSESPDDKKNVFEYYSPTTASSTLYAVWESIDKHVAIKVGDQAVMGVPYVKKNGVWCKAKGIYVKSSGQWRESNL